LSNLVKGVNLEARYRVFVAASVARYAVINPRSNQGGSDSSSGSCCHSEKSPPSFLMTLNCLNSSASVMLCSGSQNTARDMALSLRCAVYMNSSQSFFSSVVRPSLTLARSLMSSELAWFDVGTVLPTQEDW